MISSIKLILILSWSLRQRQRQKRIEELNEALAQANKALDSWYDFDMMGDDYTDIKIAVTILILVVFFYFN